MNPLEQLVTNLQDLAGQVPEVVQPVIVMLAAAVPFVEGELAAMIGILSGVHPVVAGVAAAAGNFASVLLVAALTSRARTAVVDHRSSLVPVGAGAGVREGGVVDASVGTTATEPVSKGRRRFNRWLVRFGVPGASILGPLAIPTQVTTAILVGSGTSRRWVLLWQAVAITLWTTVGTVSTWAALTYLVGVS